MRLKPVIQAGRSGWLAGSMHTSRATGPRCLSALCNSTLAAPHLALSLLFSFRSFILGAPSQQPSVPNRWPLCKLCAITMQATAITRQTEGSGCTRRHYSQPRRRAAAGPRKGIQHRRLARSLAAEAEEGDVVRRAAWRAAAGAGEVSKDAADDGGKLEAVPRAGAAQHDLHSDGRRAARGREGGGEPAGCQQGVSVCEGQAIPAVAAAGSAAAAAAGVQVPARLPVGGGGAGQ